MNKIGNIYKYKYPTALGSYYILAQVRSSEIALIGLPVDRESTTGANRWRKPVRVKSVRKITDKEMELIAGPDIEKIDVSCINVEKDSCFLSPEVCPQIGNFYIKNGDVYLLATVDSNKVALIAIDEYEANRYVEPIYYRGVSLDEDEFSAVCGNTPEEFKRISIKTAINRIKELMRCK